MLAANSSLKILKPITLGSDQRIRCFGSDATNILRVQSNIRILKTVEKSNQNIEDQPTQSSLFKENVPGYSDISAAENGYKPRILDNLLRQQVIYEYIEFPQERKEVVNYLVLLHRKLDLNPQSLYLSITLLNRSIPKLFQMGFDDLELISMACLWMAAKIEETRVPGVKHWAKFARGFDQQEIIQTQQKILAALDYSTITPTPISFLQMFQLFINFSADSRQSLLSQYILETTLLHPQLLKHSDSLVALSALHLSFKILGIEWKQTLNDILNVDMTMLRNCSREISIYFQIDNRQKLSAVYRKYMSHKYKSIANIKLGKKSDFSQ